MLKFSLAAMLLAVSTSAYAQTEQAVVKLKNGETVTWSAFANAINNGVQGTVSEEVKSRWETAQTNLTAKQEAAKTAAANVTTTKKAYDDTTNELSTAQAQLTALIASTEKKPVAWLEEAYNNAKTFTQEFNAFANGESVTGSITIGYTITEQTGGFGKKVATLNLSFYTTADLKPTGYTEGNINALAAEITDKNVTTLNIYLGSGYTENANGLLNVGNYVGVLETIGNTALAALKTLVDNGDYDQKAAQKQELTEKISTLTTQKDANYTAYTEAQEAQTAAEEALETAQTEYDEAKAAYDEAVAAANTDALGNYKDVTLIGDVTADVTIRSYDGVINGNGHVINLGSATSAFTTFTGSLINTAVNGSFAQATGGASFGTVAYWANNTGRFYDSMGTVSNVNTLGALGFNARESFGVDFSGNKLAVKTNESIVYSITIYRPNSTTQHYVVANNNKLIDSKLAEVVIPNNMFAKSETTDLTGFNNIFFDDNTCESVVINDREEFYCPVDITANNLTFNRQFKSGYNVVCLPFELSRSDNSAIDAVCSYDKETTEKFWFKKVAESIPANTPALIVANAAFSFENLSNVILKKTDSQIVVDEGDANEPSKCYGILKNATREEFKGGASEAFKIYGLKDGLFVSAGEGSEYPAFRSVIYSEIAQSSKMAAPRRIGIVDAKGIEITDELMSGVEDVTTDASSLNIAVGQGEIVITSNADLGEVAVYTIDGKTVAVANVVAGTTTVNVQSGVYVVMGKKVLVK